MGTSIVYVVFGGWPSLRQAQVAQKAIDIAKEALAAYEKARRVK